MQAARNIEARHPKGLGVCLLHNHAPVKGLAVSASISASPALSRGLPPVRNVVGSATETPECRPPSRRSRACWRCRCSAGSRTAFGSSTSSTFVGIDTHGAGDVALTVFQGRRPNAALLITWGSSRGVERRRGACRKRPADCAISARCRVPTFEAHAAICRHGHAFAPRHPLPSSTAALESAGRSLDNFPARTCRTSSTHL